MESRATCAISKQKLKTKKKIRKHFSHPRMEPDLAYYPNLSDKFFILSWKAFYTCLKKICYTPKKTNFFQWKNKDFFVPNTNHSFYNIFCIIIFSFYNIFFLCSTSVCFSSSEWFLYYSRQCCCFFFFFFYRKTLISFTIPFL